MCCKLLDTTDYDRPVGGIEWREGISSGSISYGLEIVDIEGLEQQGLQICYLAPQEIAGQKNLRQGRSTGIAVFGGSASRS